MVYLYQGKQTFVKKTTLKALMMLLPLSLTISSCSSSNNNYVSTSLPNSGSSVKASSLANIFLYIDQYSTDMYFSSYQYTGDDTQVPYYIVFGYAFAGYYSEKNGKGECITEKKNGIVCFKADLSLIEGSSYYGYYEVAVYRVTYNCSIGSPLGENPTTYTMFDKRTPLFGYEQKGYDFLGWYSTFDFKEGTLVTYLGDGMHGNLYLYGKMTLKTAKLTLTGCRVGHVNYYVGDKIYKTVDYTNKAFVDSLYEEPKKAYALFGGWYLEKELTTPFLYNAEITDNLNLYAKFFNETRADKQIFFNSKTSVSAPFSIGGVIYSTYVLISQVDQDVNLYIDHDDVKYSLSDSVPMVPLSFVDSEKSYTLSLKRGTSYYLTFSKTYDFAEDFNVKITGLAKPESSTHFVFSDQMSELYKANVTYLQSFSLPLPEILIDKNKLPFKGYYTLEGGQGRQVTDEKGGSIGTSSFEEDQTLYPYYA
jgi:hypothetical protein